METSEVSQWEASKGELKDYLMEKVTQAGTDGLPAIEALPIFRQFAIEKHDPILIEGRMGEPELANFLIELRDASLIEVRDGRIYAVQEALLTK